MQLQFMFPEPNTQEIPYGYCHCGCGQKTSIAKRSDYRTDQRKGQPFRYIRDHYRHPCPPLLETFWAAVVRREPDQCWEWQRAKTKAGYGFMQRRGVTTYAHRFSYELHHGPIPVGFYVCHHCDNPGCANPGHLFIGTAQENHEDMRRKNRHSNPPHLIGEAHHQAKLTEIQVQEIRRLYAEGRTVKQLAQEYGMSSGAIDGIVTRKTWRHVNA